ncbi:tRNA (adenosine(37)-N6)-threonylcarbamoyltransferase complex dimerization subunit type 1 TsaB [Lachnospiraceae bacterium OttesenSCG-928-E19]|nr:tRNA (adenosine(37)-N6)-threonylcarbamoyltransferase complex dimerization subunit type 1 TsaB [Lachnospiraceae bacterium OttesenSCG-928-E19]
MRILALDSSGLVASVAIVEEEQILAEYTVNYKMTHSQTLLPMLDTVVDMLGVDLNTIDAIAIAGGPGSFTGLRIGTATAKGLGLALEKPLIHIPTAEGMAYNLFGTKGLICPIMDARRNQVYTGIYRYEEAFEVVENQMAISVEEMIEKINGYGEKVVFLGDGVPVYREQIREGIRVPYAFAPANMNRQRAASVGTLGMWKLKKGEIVSAADYKPDYLRLSQAERERKEREKM